MYSCCWLLNYYSSFSLFHYIYCIRMKNIILLMLLCLKACDYMLLSIYPRRTGNMISKSRYCERPKKEAVPYTTVRVVSYNDGAVPEKLRTSGAVPNDDKGSWVSLNLAPGKIYTLRRYKPWAIKSKEKTVTVVRNFTAVLHFPIGGRELHDWWSSGFCQS